MEVWDGHIYKRESSWTHALIGVYELSDADRLEQVQTLGLTKEPPPSPASGGFSTGGGPIADIIISGGYVHTLLGNNLVIFPVVSPPGEP